MNLSSGFLSQNRRIARFILVFSIFLSVSLLLPGSILNIRDIRHNFFIVDSAAGIAASGNIFKGDSPIGIYSLVETFGQDSLCKLIQGEIAALDNTCYINTSVPLKLGDSQVKPPSVSPTTEQKNQKPAINEASKSFTFSNFNFKPLGSRDNLIISETVFSYSKFDSIENINEFLNTLNSSGSYRFNIPTELIVRENSSYFRSLYQTKLYLCLVNGRIGYSFFEDNGQLSFRNTNLASLSSMADKFHFIVIGEKI